MVPRPVQSRGENINHDFTYRRRLTSVERKRMQFFEAALCGTLMTLARVRGSAVLSLLSDKFVFGSESRRDHGLFKDGLGIQGNRDR